MSILRRTGRHAWLRSYSYRDMPSPPFLVLFINSIRNIKSEHRFYWMSLNTKADLTDLSPAALSGSTIYVTGSAPRLHI